jgi:hypothetical protein
MRLTNEIEEIGHVFASYESIETLEYEELYLKLGQYLAVVASHLIIIID